MAVVRVSTLRWHVTGNEAISVDWNYLSGNSNIRTNDHWTIVRPPNLNGVTTAVVDMGLHTPALLARSEDRLTLSNGNFPSTSRWVLSLNGVEHVDAPLNQTVHLTVSSGIGFTTDGSLASIRTGVGNHEMRYTGATRDSTLFTGAGWDQIRLADHPDVAGTQYWAVVRRDHGQVDVYSLYSGYRIRLEGGGTTWGNTGNIINYGEVDEIYAASRNRPNGDVFNPGTDLQGAGDRGSFDNIDLSNAALTSYTDRFIAASFKTIHYATQNLHTGTAIVETFNGDRTGGTQSASRDHITTNGNHYLLVNEEQTAIDGHLRLYVRDNNSGLYNRFNEIYLGTSAAEVNSNDYSTTSKNAYQNQGNGNGAGAVKVLGTAMYGFGGNDALTGGDDTDYLFGGTSTYTTIPGVLQGNIVTGGDGGDFFGVGNISVGVDGDAIMTTNFTARLAGAAPADNTPEGQLARIGAAETADLATRVATDRIQDWTAGVDWLRVLANGTAVIDGLGTTNGLGGAYTLDLIGNDAERIDLSGNRVNNEGKIVIRGLGGDDTIIGSGGADWIYGNSGNNVVLAGAAAAGDGNDRIYYDTYAGRLFAAGFDAGDKIYLNKKVLEAITGTFIRGTEAANNLTANGVTLSGNPVFDTADYAAAVAYNPRINFLHDSFYGPSGGLPTNSQHTNGPGFVDGSDNYADTSTGLIGAGMYAAGILLNIIPGAGTALMVAGLALGAGAVAGSLGWTTPHQHATYTGDISGNFLTVLTAQNIVNTTAAVDGNAYIDNVSLLDFFASANAGDGYTPGIQFTSLPPGTSINQFMAVHSDEETFIYWVYSRGDTVVTAGEAIKIAEISGRLYAEDFAIYDGTLDIYNYGTLAPIVIYTPSITAVGYDLNNDGDVTDAGDVALIDEASAAVVNGGGRFVLEGQFFRGLGDKTNPFETFATSATVKVTYQNHGLVNGSWIQIGEATPANGIDFNGAYQVTVVDANTFTFTAKKFTESNGAAGVTASGGPTGGATSFGVPGIVSAGSTIKVYDGTDRLDANPLTVADDVSVVVNGNSFTLIDTRALGTSITQSPDGVVIFDSVDNRYEDSLGNRAYFSIVSGSPTVTVNYVQHGMVLGSSVQIVGAETAGGIDFNGTWVVASANANTFTFTAANNATATQDVDTSFSFTAISAPVVVAQADINGAGGVLTVTMAGHGMLSGDRVTFGSTFLADGRQYSANTPYTVTRISDTQFSITSSANVGGGTTTPANVTFSVPNGGDQTFFLKDEKVSYFIELTNADSGFETMSLQYNFTVGGGNGILNGGRGSDTLILSDDSAALNGMTDGQIVNLETIVITNEAPDSVAFNLSNQTDGFTIHDSDASNSIIGSRGNDEIYGKGGNDTLNGHDGNDTITGGSGADNMDGGAGNDVFIIATASDHAAGDTITGGADTDAIRFTSTAGATLVLTANVDVEEARISDASGSTTGTTAENIDASAVGAGVAIALTGNDGANVLTGNAAANVINGGGGNDTITGGLGDDTINAGSGTNSILDAGQGADTIIHNAAASTVTIAVTGTSTVTLAASQVGATANSTAGVDTVVNASTSLAAVILNGNTGNDVLFGGSGNDTITAGAGDDRLEGNAGNDVFRFLSANFDGSDTVAGGGDNDTIEITDAGTVVDADFANVTSVETLVLTGASTAVLGTNATGAGIATVRTGSGATSITRSDTAAITIDAAQLANDTLLTIEGASATANFTVNNLVGDLDASNVAGTLTLDLNDNTDDNDIAIVLSGSNTTISGGAANDTIRITQVDDPVVTGIQVIDLTANPSNVTIEVGGGRQTIKAGVGVYSISTGSGDESGRDRIEFLQTGSAALPGDLTANDATLIAQISSIFDYDEDTLDFIGTDTIAANVIVGTFTTDINGVVTNFGGPSTTLGQKIAAVRAAMDTWGSIGPGENRIVIFTHDDGGRTDTYAYGSGSLAAGDSQIVRIVDDSLNQITTGSSFVLKVAPPATALTTSTSLMPSDTTWYSGSTTIAFTSFTPGNDGNSSTSAGDNVNGNTNQLIRNAAGNFGAIQGGGDDYFTTINVPTGLWANGLNMFGTDYTQVMMGSNGYVTFGRGYSGYVPSGIDTFTRSPMIAAQFDDLYTNRGARHVTPGAGSGTSTGTAQMYFYQEGNKLVFTWDNVGLYSNGVSDTQTSAGGRGSAFQIILHKPQGESAADKNFGIEYRYEEVTLQYASATAGWTAGDGVNYSLINPSKTNLHQAAFGSNTGISGVWAWMVQGGNITASTYLPDVGLTAPKDTNTISVRGFTATGYTLGGEAADQFTIAPSATPNTATLSTVSHATFNLWKDKYVDGVATVTVTPTGPQGIGATETINLSIVRNTDTDGRVDGVDHAIRTAGSDTITVGSGGSLIDASDDDLGGTPTGYTRITTIASVGIGSVINVSNQSEAYTLNGNIGVDYITGGSGNDTITGGPGTDSINAGNGDDEIRYGDLEFVAAETLIAGNGTDTIRFTANSQTISDAAFANKWNVEVIALGNGTNSLTLGANATLATNDLGHSAVTVTGGTGADTINASALGRAVQIDAGTGADVLTGSDYEDTINGGGDNDTITGGLGNDTINAGSGTNSVTDAGQGTDTIVHDQAGSTVAVAVTGTDTVTLTASQVGATANSTSGVDTKVNASTSTAAVTLNGNDGADSLVGGSGDDTINGGFGADTLIGGNGDDVINGGGGTDIITGGNGADVMNAGVGLGTITDAGQGADTVIHDSPGLVTIAVTGTDTVTLTASQVGATANSAVAVNTTVNASSSTAAVTLNGNTGNDTLTGGAGNDTITGGAGADSIDAGNGADDIRYGSGEFVAGETVDGGAGTDTIRFMADNETIGDAAFANKRNIEAIVLGNGTNSLTLGANATLATNDLGTSAVTVTGGTGADTINASALGRAVQIDAGTGADVLTGSNYADTITGGAGIDSLTGGAGADLFSFVGVSSAADRDTVTDFSAGSGGDLIGLDASYRVGATVVMGARDANLNLASDGTIFDVSLILNTAQVGALVLDGNRTNADLSSANDGTELLKYVADSAGTASSIKLSAQQKLYVIASDDSNSYLYLLDTGNDDEADASEISLVGVLNNVDVIDLVSGNFILI